MAIREQGYRHWDGEYTGHGLRWWTIAKTNMRTPVYTKGRLAVVLILVACSWILPFFFGMQYFFLEEQNVLRSPDDLLRQNLAEVLTIWTWMWLVIFSAIIAAPLVSNDLRSEALYIYLAKPMRRTDYVIGKFVACFLWLIPVSLLPALWIFFAAAGASNELFALRNPTEIFFETVFVYTFLMLVCAAVAVTISSFTKRWMIALIAWPGAVFLLFAIANLTADASKHQEWLYLSFRDDMIFFARHVWELVQTSPAWDIAVWILLGIFATAASVFLVRILRIEVSE